MVEEKGMKRVGLYVMLAIMLPVYLIAGIRDGIVGALKLWWCDCKLYHDVEKVFW